MCVFLVRSGQRRGRRLLNINPEVCFEVCGGSWMSPVCVWVREGVCAIFLFVCISCVSVCGVHMLLFADVLVIPRSKWRQDGFGSI